MLYSVDASESMTAEIALVMEAVGVLGVDEGV